MTTKLFVYGTLKPGRSRWPMLQPHLEPDAPVVDDAVDGRLWSTRWGWPALTKGSETVRGVLVELRSDRVDVALAEIDAVEGVGSGLFERSEVVTRRRELLGLPVAEPDRRVRAGGRGLVRSLHEAVCHELPEC